MIFYEKNQLTKKTDHYYETLKELNIIDDIEKIITNKIIKCLVSGDIDDVDENKILKKKDYICLNNNSLINDNIINECGYKIFKDSNIKYMNNDIYILLKKGEYRKFFKKCENINNFVFLINENEHWMVVYVEIFDFNNNKHACIKLFDSYFACNYIQSTIYNEIFNVFSKMLIKYFNINKENIICMHSTTMQQTDGVNCGIYSIINLYFIRWNLKSTPYYTLEKCNELRLVILHELLYGNFDESFIRFINYYRILINYNIQ